MTHTVIGGGLAGLTAAVELARAGAKVRLIERHQELGGRALTNQIDGFSLNLGPHAVYLDGAMARTLREWGILPHGATPVLADGAYMTLHGEKHPMVRSVASLATSSFLSVLEKVEAARVLTRLTSGDAESGRGKTVSRWLDDATGSVAVRRLAEALFRVSTYCDDGDSQSAEAALRQTALGAKGVMYVDGGWSSITRNLEAYARSLGVAIETGVVAGGVEPGTVLAVPPREAEQLTGRKLPKTKPIRMAALDIALDELPPGAAIFALGLDEPLYYSLHSRWAKVASEGGAVVHIGKYLGARAADAGADRAQLERFADLLMPGWRDRVHHARFLPEMQVTHAVVGLEGRPDADTLGLPGVRLAGDWVGPEAMLADAAVASGHSAAQAILRHRAAA